MKLTRRQLINLIKENLLVEKDILENELRGFKRIIQQSDGISVKTSNGYDIFIDNLKAKYSSNLVGLKNDDNYKNIMGSIKNIKPSKRSTKDDPILIIIFELPGKLYGENQIALHIKLNRIKEGEGSYTQNLDAGTTSTNKVLVAYNSLKQSSAKAGKTKDDDDIKKNVKTFKTRIPWAQTSRYEDDVRFFQLFILYCIAGENLMGMNILDNKEFVYKMLGSVNRSKYPDGFDGQWGPTTTRTWNALIDKFPDELDKKMYSTITGTKNYSKNIEDIKAQLKDYKKVTAKLPVDKFIQMIDDAVGIQQITGTDRTLERMVEEAIEIGIAIPESYAKFA